MKHLIGMLWLCIGLLTGVVAQAQTASWIQIEAQPTLRQAQQSARNYAADLTDVNGFQIGSGWYALALGPYNENQAAEQLRALRRNGAIPRDSYVTDGTNFRQRFWPVGAAADAPVAAPAPSIAPQEPVVQVIEEETPAQARRSEAQLSRDEKMLLQEALQWEGFYTAKIDGSYGRGTRGAMAEYQGAMGYEQTGVLTTRQRDELVSNYRAQFAKLGMATVEDNNAGISLSLPAALASYARLEPPFVHYDSATDDDVRVLLISQTGDQSTLFGLYDIMQTLEIVPMEGDRTRGERSFTLTGQSADLHSYTYAALKDGAVKGFTLIWKPEDAKLMNRAAQMMRESFAPVQGVVLDDLAGDNSGPQSIDLLAGLEIRRPDMSRSGFYIDDAGTVLTTVEALGQCQRITVNDEYEMQIAARSDALGVAVLRPSAALAPAAYAAFQTGLPRLQSDVAVAGFSYEGVLDLPVLTYGTLADLKGLAGEAAVYRLDLDALPGDTGGPVFDASGAVMGMLLGKNDSARQLPGAVRFTASVPAIAEFLSESGVQMAAAETASQIAPEDLSALASDITVLVSCWN
ncbi:peptidoglycan binding domain-containing protein [Actibacterium atlanticum]|uniref:Peptidoglycan binding domain-containing protein n=1 Tax=Actibacterium atlanticum TaxID=1461693 RepID=A0A058ZNV9_9RHOB|nr:serine protease [Actibacterium atlanticum]KCV83274.1 peptidoglycan binding domain-containing protein [Actibacterium atlanticum]